MRLKAGKYDKNLIFRKTFESWKSVADDGGTVTGTPTINRGLTCTYIS